MCRYLEDMGLVERKAEMQELNVARPGRSRDLFGVQLEVRNYAGISIQQYHLARKHRKNHKVIFALIKAIRKRSSLLRDLESGNSRESERA